MGDAIRTCPSWWLTIAAAASLFIACNGPSGSGSEDVGSTSLTVRSGEEVVLDGSRLFGGVGSATYQWEQLGGPTVPISDPTAATIRFVAPDVSEPTFIVISLTAFQSELSATTLYTVTILPAADSPPGGMDGGSSGGLDGGSSDAGTPDTDGGTPPSPPMTLAFNSLADTYVDEGSPSSNFGSDGELKTDQDDDERIYVKFDVSRVSAPVTRARLRLLVENGSGDGPAVHETGTSWREGSLTWDSQPGAAGAALHDAGSIPSGSWFEYDVTSAVDGDGEVAFVLMPTSSDGCDFTSREGGSAPQLVVDFGGSGGGSDGGGSCGDGTCGSDESCTSCSADCGACTPSEECGNGTCETSEDCTSCSADCGTCAPAGTCGNGTCNSNEHCDTCSADCGACGSAAPPLARGSYLQRVSDDEITVKWRTSQATDSVVVFGPSPTSLDRRTNVAGGRTRHEVRLTGLSADTKYYYAFGASDATLHGKTVDYFFNTSPAPGSAAPTRIWVIGDSGDVGSGQQAVYDQYRAYTGSRGTDLWLMLGDNAYGDGTDSEYQAGVFDAYSGMLRNTPLFPTLGNHDACLDRTSESDCTDLPTSLDSVSPYYEIFTLPEDGELGGVASGTEAYYSFDYGNIHFVCLNSETHSSSSAMQTWLESDLTATNAEWIIAFWHHPAYSNGSHNSDDSGTQGDMRTNFASILESYGVDLIFAGHSHNYERSAFLNGYYGDSSTFDPDQHVLARNADGSLSDGDPMGDGAYAKTGSAGAVYSVVGSSSKVSDSDYPSSYWTCPDGFMQSCNGGPLLPGMMVYLEHLGSVVVDINESAGIADVVFLDTDTGTIGDRFRIQK